MPPGRRWLRPRLGGRPGFRRRWPGLGWAGGQKSGGDDDAAQLGEHVGEGRLGLGGVPGGSPTPVGEVGAVVAVQGAPEHGDRVAVQAERDGAAHGVLGAVAGLADAEKVAGLGEGDLDRPAPGVSADQRCRAAVPVGGDQGQVVAGVRAVVAQQDDADGFGVEGPVPQGSDLSEIHGVGTAVPVHLGFGEPGGGGELGRGTEPGAFERRASAPSGGRRGQVVEHRVGRQPGGEGEVAGQRAQCLAVIGGVGHDVQVAAVMAGGQETDHRCGGLDFGLALLGPPQSGHHRQTDRACRDRQRDDQADHHEADPAPGRAGAFGRAVVLPGHPEHLLARALE
jgi:hypothetical protein